MRLMEAHLQQRLYPRTCHDLPAIRSVLFERVFSEWLLVKKVAETVERIQDC
jgi:hypothetical protein